MDLKKLWKEWILPFGLEIIVVLLIMKYVCFFVIVPTGSMIPTIAEHSFLFATRVHNLDKLERGDILIFDSDELDKKLVKRLVGLPGDEIILDFDGSMILNGEKVEEPYVKNQSRGGWRFKVPEGHYLFMGDNRAGSLDARYWRDTYIPAEKIQGKAIFTIWPIPNFGVLK